MALDYIRKTMAASVQPMPQFNVRQEFITQVNQDTGHLEVVGVKDVTNSRRLHSRGKGGKQAHRFSGVRRIRRAAGKI